MQSPNAFQFLSLALLATLPMAQARAASPDPVRAAEAKVVYGTDDRIDLYAETIPSRRAWAASVCAVISVNRVVDDGAGGYLLATSAYLRSGKPACDGEPFGNQPVASNCSAFLVGDDLVATAGHCINDGNMNSWRFVFGFAMLDAGTPVTAMTADQVYTPVEIVGYALQTNGADYAIVRLDRDVTAPGATPLPLRRNGLVDIGTPLGVIGHPAGLPLKLAFGPATAVRDNAPSTHFKANLDTFGGNSGSPVFDATSGLVEGILVRGEADYLIGTECFTSNYIADNAGRGEDVTKSTLFADLVPPLLSSTGSVTFDRARYTCGASALLTVKDSDHAGEPSISITLQRNAAPPVAMSIPATPAGDGTFETTVELASFALAHEDTLAATYEDASDAAGAPATATDTAAMDCEGPVLSGLTIGPVYSTLAVVAFTTTEVATDRVDYGAACDSLANSAASANAGTTHIIGVTGLTPGTTYHLAVSATDALGNETLALDGGNCFVIQTPQSVDRLTERFTAGNDLAFSRLTFTPDGSDAFYDVCVEPATVFSSNPAGGTALSLTDDAFAAVPLLDGQAVSLFGVAYNTVYVSSNGVITFTAGDISHQESLTVHFSSPRVSLWHDDFLPGSGATISWMQLANRLVVTYDNLAEINTTNSNTMQAELFFDGRIRLTYLQMDSRDGIAGLSGTDSYPLDFVASDLSSYPACSATEGEEEDPIYFPDPALEAAIRAALGIPVAPILPSNMTGLLELDASGLGITNLEGLQYATAITALDLSNNALTTLGALSALSNLTTLGLAENAVAITSLAPLVANAAFASKDTLDVYCSPLADAALSGLLQLGARGVEVSFYFGPGCTSYTSEGEAEEEGSIEGYAEGEGQAQGYSSADTNFDGVLSLSELLRVIQFYNFAALHCNPGVADGFAPGPGTQDCAPHTTDYNPQSWRIELSELLRMIQFYNEAGYVACPEGEDGFCVVS